MKICEMEFKRQCEIIRQSAKTFACNTETRGLIDWLFDERISGNMEKAKRIENAISNMAEKKVLSCGIFEKY